MLVSKEEQLRAWVAGMTRGKGTAAHAINLVKGLRVEECVPDYSCCYSHLEAPRQEREQFVSAERMARTEMLVKFLAAYLKGRAVGRVPLSLKV